MNIILFQAHPQNLLSIRIPQTLPKGREKDGIQRSQTNFDRLNEPRAHMQANLKIYIDVLHNIYN